MLKKSKYKNVAVVGVGAVGKMMLRVLKERKFPVDQLKVLARTARKIRVDGKVFNVEKINHESFRGIDIALFAGTEGEKGASVVYSSSAIRAGAVVVDNGGDFRMKKDVPLVIPEVNPEDIKKHRGLIANPNCSTIQMLVALYPIHKAFGLKRVIVSTYQAASGAGQAAIEELLSQSRAVLQGKAVLAPKVMGKQIAFNVIPKIGEFLEDAYTSEEIKLVKESHKILHTSKIKISATCVRVPVVNSHAEAIYIEVKKKSDVGKIRNVLKSAKGVKVVDQPKAKRFSLPIEASGKDAVYVSRIRKDAYVKGAFWIWVVSDNLRKGAATNAVQIAEYL
ncbi:aspartate-semialdehyde dehydrogenase [PVC group bacterium]|nr:aspartate-semialdehyde dehydrogenase [PVC group bacterium]